jgi:hypothetical protein
VSGVYLIWRTSLAFGWSNWEKPCKPQQGQLISLLGPPKYEIEVLPTWWSWQSIFQIRRKLASSHWNMFSIWLSERDHETRLSCISKQPTWYQMHKFKINPWILVLNTPLTFQNKTQTYTQHWYRGAKMSRWSRCGFPKLKIINSFINVFPMKHSLLILSSDRLAFIACQCQSCSFLCM